MSEPAMLGERFDEALRYASELHREQTRKGTSVPYVSHLLAVSALALEAGADEDQAVAALLHDAAEDQGGEATLAEIGRRFGPRVEGIVAACTDTTESPQPPWRERKERLIAQLEAADDDALLVALADKAHNARSIARDLRAEGPSLWERFHAGPHEQLWYHETLAELFSRRLPGPLADELADTVEELRAAIHPSPAHRPRS